MGKRFRNPVPPDLRPIRRYQHLQEMKENCSWTEDELTFLMTPCYSERRVVIIERDGSVWSAANIQSTNDGVIDVYDIEWVEIGYL